MAVDHVGDLPLAEGPDSLSELMIQPSTNPKHGFSLTLSVTKALGAYAYRIALSRVFLENTDFHKCILDSGAPLRPYNSLQPLRVNRKVDLPTFFVDDVA